MIFTSKLGRALHYAQAYDPSLKAIASFFRCVECAEHTGGNHRLWNGALELNIAQPNPALLVDGVNLIPSEYW